MAGILYLVPTPIGNLGDISIRCRETLEQADFIAAEDTRVTLKLLNHLGIKKSLVSYFEHNKASKGDMIVERILAGETCALVSDAGSPAISDPGEDLVKQCAEAGVTGIVHFGMGVTLRDGSREHYYTQLDRKFPGIKERTIRTYGSAYELRSAHHRELSDLFHTLCAKYGIWHDNDRIFQWLSRLEEPEQLRFWEQEAI